VSDLRTRRHRPGNAAGYRLLLAAGAIQTAVACAAEQMDVATVRNGGALEVHARATIRAPHSVIWQTLTDYDRLAEFIPGMRKSRVTDRQGSRVTVEQTGAAGFLIFTYTFDVVLESDEHPPSAIGVRLLRGNLKQLEGGYRIEPSPAREGEYILRWNGVVEGDIALPQVIAVPLMRARIEDQFYGMVREIERREALRIKAPPE
jgi:ribosome-associated toxin RatA of RatAB toxin-antitoxin module